MKIRLLLILFFLSILSYSQTSLEYQKPPQDILDLVDVELAPNAMFNSDRSLMITLQRDAFNSIENLSKYGMGPTRAMAVPQRFESFAFERSLIKSFSRYAPPRTTTGCTP